MPMAFRDYSIGKKMILVCMLTSIAALFLANTIIIAFEQFSYRRTQEQEIRVLADIVANHSQAALLFGDADVATNNLKSLTAREAIISACIYLVENPEQSNENARTRLFAQYQRDAARWPGCPDVATLQDILNTGNVFYTDEYFELVRSISLEERTIGTVLIRTTLIDAALRFKENILVAITVAVLAALAALLVASRLEKLISSPLLSLGKTARAIAMHDDYSLRASKYGSDEVGEVVDSFNHMLARIEEEDAILRENEERFRLFSASSSVGIFQTDVAGHCNYANERLADIGRTSINHLMRHGWLSLVHPDDYDQMQSHWQQTLLTGNAMTINCRFLSHESELTWITGNVGPLTSSNGDAIGFLGTLSDISELKRAQLQLEHLAFYDMLTGLANRRLFRDRIEHILANCRRNQTSLALMFIDLDHFKHTNDTLGHDSGDALLRIVADRLNRCVRTSDTVARLGGDEFTVILVDVRNSIAVSKVAEHILDEVRKPIYIDGHEISVTASIGIVLSSETENPRADQLIKNADLALYRAKDEGRNAYRFFIEDMNTQLVEHLQMVKDFRDALNSKEFVLHYQPQFELGTQSIIGFEALVRWVSPKRGFVSPMDFIPVAEETGLIIELGNWILLKACHDMKTLLEEKLVDENSVIAVNLSVKQLIEENLVENIQHALITTGLSPYQLELEITESMLMENIDRALRNVEAIRQLGVMLSIDDFGTGYSSLSYLKRLPVHSIKVDRSFVRDIPADKDDMEITAAVIAMAHKLNYKVVAEGIETQEQLSFLRDCRCDYGQGYLFSKPLPLDDLKQFCLKHQTPATARQHA